MTLEPFVSDSDFTLYVGDVRDVLAGLPDGSVDCVVTSPPYWGLRDYGTGVWAGGDPGCDHLPPMGDAAGLQSSTLEGGKKTTAHQQTGYGAVCGKCGATRVDQQIGLEPTPEAYVEQIVAVFRQVRRVLADHGTCWVNLGDSYAQGHGGSSTEGKGVTIHKTNRDAAVPRDREDVDVASWSNRDHTPKNVIPGLKPKDLVGIPWAVAKALQAPYYAGRITAETDRVWLAAVIEAEGCLFIHKRKIGQSNGQGYVRKTGTYGAGLEVSSTDRVIVERCLAITGIGSICEQTPEQNARRKQTLYRWNVRSNECRWIIRELYPHFYAKQHEARLLLGCPSSGEDAHKAHESLKALHQGQTACIDFGEPEGMWERGWFLRSEIIWAKLCRTPCLNP